MSIITVNCVDFLWSTGIHVGPKPNIGTRVIVQHFSPWGDLAAISTYPRYGTNDRPK